MIRLDNSTRKLSGLSGFFLDVIRMSAAIIILTFNIYLHWLPNNVSTVWLGNFAHTGVIIFFVLSGYVVGYTTINNNRGGITFIQARLSRLYSAVVPALIISAICQLIILFMNPTVYDHIIGGASWLRYVMTGLFINEIWLFSSEPPINAPLWLLSFEFWYYMVFGLFIYRRKGWKWLLPCIAACCIAGPKILLLMPIWLFGYFAYKTPRIIMNPMLAWIFVFALLISGIFFGLKVLPMPNKLGTEPLQFASQFLSDWIIGIIVALSLWALPSIKAKTTTENKYILSFRSVADLSFPIYVLHAPIIILWDVLFHPTITNESQLWVPFTVVLISCAIISMVLEKYRYLLTNFFKNIFATLSNKKERSLA